MELFEIGSVVQRRCRLKDFLSGALARGHHGEHSCEVLKFGPEVQKMLFKEKVYRRWKEGRRTKTDHNSSP